jgi:hypothetical protein
MQLTLTDDETRVLADAVKSRMDGLLSSIVRADSRSFRDTLITEGRTLEGIYEKLGCAHAEWSEAKGCDFKSA